MHTDILYFHDINIVACLTSKQRLKRGYIFVICDLLGAHACTDVCIVHTKKIMSCQWYEVGGEIIGSLIGSIKRLNKLCDIRIGQDRRKMCVDVCTCIHRIFFTDRAGPVVSIRPL